jgi:hypothetical protein
MNPEDRPTELERLEQEILSGLNGITPESPVWKSIMTALRFYFTTVENDLLLPGLSSEERHFQAGGANRLLEFQNFLETKRAQAQTVAGVKGRSR